MKPAPVIAACAALVAGAAGAGPLALPPAPRPEFTQNVGATLPLEQRFVDDDGTPVRLRQLLGGRGALLVFGYYRCPMLCGVVASGVLEALARAQLPDDAVRIVEVGIDPRETPADAAQKKADYARRFGARAGAVHLLTGTADAVGAVAAAAGFHYSWDAAQAQWIHPAGFAVLTPQGRVSRYFLGVRFDPRELKDALARAGDGQTGSVLQRLLLLCAHYDPAVGRNSSAAMAVVRGVCVGVCALLAVWIWRRRRPRRTGA